MTTTALAIDKNTTTGLPAYTGQGFRQGMAGLLFNGTARALGSQSGVVPGHAPTMTLSSSTWIVGAGNYIVDAAFTTTQGPYLVANDASVSGPVTAAGSVARTDALDLRVDDTAIDSTGLRQAVFVYTAGNATTGATPALADRSIRLFTFSVPAAGNGSPTYTLNAQFAVASGGVLPVANISARDSLITNPHSGMACYLRDVNQLQVYNGSAWVVVGSVPSGRLFQASRSTATTSDSWASASGFTLLLQVNLPSNAPAGTYTYTTDLDISVSIAASGNLRVILPDGSNDSADRTINPIATSGRTPVHYGGGFNWAGGSGVVQVLVSVSNGSGTVYNAGAALVVTYIGP